ncbi:NAD(P)-dependent dehydrogenase, short-chain alcohol dehydrogenase family [Mariniphaga anaerophila]|uniref:NAD(P)-dependent dehydrogenase, short-chain alcohol dehydrogenase family n=1 Tax=Mariniphaga anaerophila TaxID=1484053 RepID=A0A1M5F9T3_9BACT|nr:SDR family oxidoreductase [Mariniphaga anaerophila]SHF88236.1 NAD(P)-dependent dehydrogenase, short-chain alcohol dehydrogenase family [Mariniphaga anaerophila]
MKVHDNILRALSLEGKVAVVSGGASGIGLGSATKLAEAGANIALLDVNEEKGEQAKKQIAALGVQVIFIRCDVRMAEDCRNAANKVFDTFGRIDILHNNAGIAVRKNAVDLEPDEWDLALDVSLKGQYLLSKYIIPYMKKGGGGSIINTGSGWSLRGGENAVAYCAMKGGTLNMTRAMCIDHGKDNIRVNTVCPGDVDTPMLRSECEQLGGQYNDDYKTECAQRPIARLGTPEDVGNAVLFLASDLSSWVSGAYLVVDGGGIA